MRKKKRKKNTTLSLSPLSLPPPPQTSPSDVHVHLDVDLVRRHQLPDLAEPEVPRPDPLPGDRPGTPELNPQVPLVARAVVVARRRDPEEPVLAPGAAPRVAHDPVLDRFPVLVRLAVGIFHAPADDRDQVVDLGLLDVLLEDPVASRALVAVELVGGVDAAGDGPAGVDLGLWELRVEN